MLEGKTKSIFDRKITFLGLAAIIAALAAINFSETALAYTADDPGVVYSCFETNEDGSYVTQTNNETRSEEHTSELQSRQYLVCRLLLEKKTLPLFLLRSSCNELFHE